MADVGRIEMTPEQLVQLVEQIQNKNPKYEQTSTFAPSTLVKVAAFLLFTYAVYHWGKANALVEPKLETALINYDPNVESGIAGFVQTKLAAMLPQVSPLAGINQVVDKTTEVFHTVGNTLYYTTLSAAVSVPTLAFGYLARAFRRPG